MSVLRKVRGLLGVGFTWGAAWGAIGAAIGFAVGGVRPEVWTLTNPVVEWALGMGAYGLVSGIAFGGLLALREGRRSLFDLSLRRVAMWGLLGSALVPLVFLGWFDAGTTLADILGAVAVTGALGGIFAPGAVAIARRAALGEGEEPVMLRDGR